MRLTSHPHRQPEVRLSRSSNVNVAVKSTVSSINTAKKQIDEARLVIEQKKHERMEEDGLVDEEGEPIISEEEFSALSRLREVTASEPRAPMFYWTPRPPF
jgi:hypothetical protein